MRLVIIESPFAGDRIANLEYLQRCIRDCISRGESPYASHQMLTDALDDGNPAERDVGIRAGYAWWTKAGMIVFYEDLGWSPGMHKAFQRAKIMQKAVEKRRLG